MSAKHTDGKLTPIKIMPGVYGIEVIGKSGAYDDGRQAFCSMEVFQEAEADSIRLAACWNACANLADPSVVLDMIVALRSLVATHDYNGDHRKKLHACRICMIGDMLTKAGVK